MYSGVWFWDFSLLFCYSQQYCLHFFDIYCFRLEFYPLYGVYNPKSFSIAKFLKHFRHLYTCYFHICTAKKSADTYWNFAFFYINLRLSMEFFFYFYPFLRVANTKVILQATWCPFVKCVYVCLFESHKISNGIQYFRNNIIQSWFFFGRYSLIL